MAKPRNIHIIFPARDFKIRNWRDSSVQTIRAGVYIDLDALLDLVVDAAKNKGRKAHDGALHVEFHSEVR